MQNVVYLNRPPAAPRDAADPVEMLHLVRKALLQRGREAIIVELLNLNRVIASFDQLVAAQPPSPDRNRAMQTLQRVRADISRGFELMGSLPPAASGEGAG